MITLNVLVFLELIFEDWMDLKSYWNNLLMKNFDYMGLKDYWKLRKRNKRKNPNL